MAILTLLVLLFTVFALKMDNISISMHNDFNFDSQQTFLNDLKTNSNLKQNTSVFFINKTEVTNQVEKSFPYVKVINIETTFPNGLVFHLAKREALFSVLEEETNQYYFIDADLKVLEIIPYADYQNNLILLENSIQISSNIQTGDFLSKNDNESIICDLARAFLLNNRDVTEQIALFEKIEIKEDLIREYLTDDTAYIEITLHDDFKIYLYSAHTFCAEKVRLMLSALTETYPLYQNSHFMEIFEKINGDIFCKLTLKAT